MQKTPTEMLPCLSEHTLDFRFVELVKMFIVNKKIVIIPMNSFNYNN